MSRSPLKRLPTLGRLAQNILILSVALAVAIVPLLLSRQLMTQMEEEEHFRIVTWAKATEALASQEADKPFSVMLHIIESNKTIPVILATDRDSIISYNNIPMENLSTDTLSYLQHKLQQFKEEYAPIEIDLSNGKQYLYYSDSITLTRLQRFPYWQTAVFFLYLLVLLAVIRNIRRNELNRIWVGLSKETAHQLGTPISSLLAWVELLDNAPELAKETYATEEMRKDLQRLSLIADRFQKIGSTPQLTPTPLYPLLQNTGDYLLKRISQQVTFLVEVSPESDPQVLLSPPLFEWVIENLVKNAVDAMEGKGTIWLKAFVRGDKCIIDVKDTGRGIAKKDRRRIFTPGFTTKSRGWGLGLSLAKRIIHSMFRGRIFVKNSELNAGTIIRIVLPCLDERP